MPGDAGASDPHERVRRRIAAATAAWAGGMSLDEIRASFEAFMVEAGGAGPAATLPGVDLEVAGVPARRFDPPQAPDGGLLLYCHGGGYQIGSVRSHAGLMSRLATATATRVLGFDYRLAPEHRFPAASDDALAVYAALATSGDVPLAIAGDSAGGALALATCLRARDLGLPLPRAIVLISPWLDMTMSGASYHELAERDIFSRPAQLKAMARTYLGRDHLPSDPLASPVLADLAGLPPILVHAGGHDITLDDSLLLAQVAARQGVAVTLDLFPGMYHHFQVFADLPEADLSLRRIGDFVRALRVG